MATWVTALADASGTTSVVTLADASVTRRLAKTTFATAVVGGMAATAVGVRRAHTTRHTATLGWALEMAASLTPVGWLAAEMARPARSGQAARGRDALRQSRPRRAATFAKPEGMLRDMSAAGSCVCVKTDSECSKRNNQTDSECSGRNNQRHLPMRTLGV